MDAGFPLIPATKLSITSTNPVLSQAGLLSPFQGKGSSKGPNSSLEILENS
jgi:hypothetical protein